MKQSIEFLIRRIEGEIVSTSNEDSLRIYNKEMGRYWTRQSELYDLAYPKTKEDEDSFESIFGNIDQKPVFNIDAKMIEEGYLYQSVYSYKPEDGENGHGIYETPFAKIESFLLDQKLSFSNSDGVCVASEKVVITFK